MLRLARGDADSIQFRALEAEPAPVCDDREQILGRAELAQRVRTGGGEKQHPGAARSDAPAGLMRGGNPRRNFLGRNRLEARLGMRRVESRAEPQRRELRSRRGYGRIRSRRPARARS